MTSKRNIARARSRAEEGRPTPTSVVDYEAVARELVRRGRCSIAILESSIWRPAAGAVRPKETPDA